MNKTAPNNVKAAGNFRRKKTDFLWMLAILGLMITLGEYFFPKRSSPEDLIAFKNLYDPLQIEVKHGSVAKWVLWWFITMLSMNSITWSMFLYFLKVDPANTSKKHLWD